MRTIGSSESFRNTIDGGNGLMIPRWEAENMPSRIQRRALLSESDLYHSERETPQGRVFGFVAFFFLRVEPVLLEEPIDCFHSVEVARIRNKPEAEFFLGRKGLPWGFGWAGGRKNGPHRRGAARTDYSVWRRRWRRGRRRDPWKGRSDGADPELAWKRLRRARGARRIEVARGPGRARCHLSGAR
jgi:hypothetical protein